MAQDNGGIADEMPAHVPAGAAPRLYQRVVEILRDEIETGQLSAGDRLKESHVADRFGVSRAPARQALGELERSGLLRKADGRGYVVKRRKRLDGDVAPGRPDERPFRLASSPTWERIYGEVESEIAARIAFGAWRVNEAELARHYEVSRTVARDVVGRLQQRGVIRKDERSRWYAPALTPDHVGELYELRWLLEPVALAKAAPKLPAGLLERMRVGLEDALANARDLEGATLDRLEVELHIELLGHCGNGALMQAITLPQSLLIAHRFLYRWTPRLFETEPFLPQHLEIVESLQRGRTKAAAKELEAHLRDSLDRALSRIDVIVREMKPDPLAYLDRLS